MDWSTARQIATDPDPMQRYFISQAFQVGNLIFLSGHVPIDDDGNTVGVGDFDAQFDQTMRNIERVLRCAGSGLERIFKVTIYLTDMAHRENVFALRQRWFEPPYPADTLIAVAALGVPERLIEIEAIALAEGKLIG